MKRHPTPLLGEVQTGPASVEVSVENSKATEQPGHESVTWQAGVAGGRSTWHATVMAL